MSAELIIIIIGILFLLLGLSTAIKRQGEPLGLVNTNLGVALGVIGILLIIYGGFSYGTLIPPGQVETVVVEDKKPVEYPVKDIQVISPLQGDSVKCRILTMGVYPMGHNKDIWVLLKPTDEKYYPQSDDTNTSFKHNGEWQVITRFGGDQGEAFDVVIYETNSAATEFFSNTIADWKAAESYPGLEVEEIPVGAVEVDRITVYLEGSCRGVF
ncbi:hypothetical protein ACT6NV_08590 [Robiginitalea sp. IMCC44478]|uniref:hypothetical protein n=1 Tax=Robiginitalea sp. IMCC44478 TaxID=3459122 RepID=UPI0040431EFF